MSEHENDDPQALFREAMQGVRPIKGKKRHDQQRRPSEELPESTAHARRAAAAQQAKNGGGAALSESWIEPIGPEQRIDYSRPGLQLTRLRQLRKGMLPIRYELDLHGYKIEEARNTIYDFVSFCKSQDFTCVRIIHGKSHRSQNRQATLKSHVNHWLRQIPDVLAFSSAPAAEGGTGSVLVLLKKR